MNDFKLSDFSVITIDSKHKDYPASWRKLGSKQPETCSYIGDISLLNRPSMAVVGSRKMNESSRNWMESEISQVAESGVVLASGGAVGVDQYTLELALRVGAPTITVIPTGFNFVYPESLRKYFEMILKTGGLILSPFPPDQRVRRNLFHLRNQCLVGLSQMLLVVQAERRSGSWLSATLALKQGKDIAVVPDHPTQDANLGCLDLLIDGAIPIRDVRDLRVAFENSRPAQLNLIEAQI